MQTKAEPLPMGMYPGKRPLPAPVPADPPLAWYRSSGPGSKEYAEKHWEFMKWVARKQRRKWMGMACAPFSVSPEARYRDAS